MAAKATTLRLPDGAVVTLGDWIDDKLYGAVEAVDGDIPACCRGWRKSRSMVAFASAAIVADPQPAPPPQPRTVLLTLHETGSPHALATLLREAHASSAWIHDNEPLFRLDDLTDGRGSEIRDKDVQLAAMAACDAGAYTFARELLLHYLESA